MLRKRECLLRAHKQASADSGRCLIERIDLGGSTLVVTGEPGIGKSALLEVARHQASERGVSALSMTGVLAEVHLPFAALEQALRPLMKRAEGLVPRQRSALLAAFAQFMGPEACTKDVLISPIAKGCALRHQRKQLICGERINDSVSKVVVVDAAWATAISRAGGRPKRVKQLRRRDMHG